MVANKSLNTYSNNRGSEWRLWDLHLHTPSSYDYKDKSITNQQLIEALRDAGISVVAITDHHTIDINRIRQLQELGNENKITVLPGIEFCSELGGSESVHFIGIFSESADLDTIWTKIQGHCNLTPSEVERKGIEKICCPFEKTANLIRELGGLISIHAGKKSNSVECIKNNLLVKQEFKQDLLTNFKPILEVGKETDIDGYRTIVFPSIKFSLPTIICSDNHDIKEYVCPNLWIKADPTFEGLKQVLYEPFERVAINENRPDYKPSYLTIESIELRENDFWDQKVLLNKNLNTIIGGRSTGKSTFLSVIASKFSTVNIEDSFVNEHNQSVKVMWSDGNEAYDREIDFLRQSYMFDIAKNPDETNKLLMDIVRNNEACKNALVEYDRKVTSISTETQRILNTLLDVFSQGLEKWQLIKQIGDKSGLEKEVENLTSQQEKILSDTNIDPKFIQDFNKYSEELAKIRALNENIIQEISSLQNLKSSSFLLLNKSVTYTGISVDIATLISSKVTEEHRRTQSVILNIIDEQIKKLDTRKKENEISIQKLLASPEYQRAKLVWEQNKKLTTVNKLINDQNLKLQKLNQATEDFNNLKQQTEELRKELLSVHRNFHIACNEVSNTIKITHDGIEIRGEIEFDSNKMQEYIEAVLDQRVSEMKTTISEFCNKYEQNDETYLIDFIKKSNNAKLALKGNISNTDILYYLFSTNWFRPRIGLYYENDGFHDMSQGKQAFVILKLLLDFSDKKCPILIDQPEDSLDNRAIYNELVKYIRKKKKERQIILVTHNPNIVVGADTEEVIVANQQGLKSPNENNVKFQYVYGSLENTKVLKNDESIPLLFRMGIREHVCEILEGGREAFVYREKKYGFNG